MTDPASTAILKVSGVGKRFSRDQRETQERVAEAVNATFWPWARQPAPQLAKEFWALRNISFVVRRGSALGIIGFNGAGKTTLLRLLTGHMLPDAGTVEINGRAAAMIDLTAGFQNNMSGRENIFLRSAALGRNRAQTDALLDQIIDFAELDDAIDAPLHTFSAGMKMRLAFATIIFMDPDLLIIDEVLSVGDFHFRQKCLARIRELRSRCAFVLVSHSMGDIARFCEHVIVLERGRIAFQGKPAEAIAFYEKKIDGKPKPAAAKAPQAGVLGSFFHNEKAISDVEHAWIGADGSNLVEVAEGAQMALRVRFRAGYRFANPIIGVPIFNSDGRFVTALTSEQTDTKIEVVEGKVTEVSIQIPKLALVPGRYRSVVAIVDGPEFLYRQPHAELSVKHGLLRRYFGDVVSSQKWSARIVD